MKWLSSTDFKAELRHRLIVALRVTKIRKKYLFKGLFDRDTSVSDRCSEQIVDEMLDILPSYEARKSEPKRAHSIDCGQGEAQKPKRLSD